MSIPIRKLTVPEIAQLDEDAIIGLRLVGGIVKARVLGPVKIRQDRKHRGRFGAALFHVAVEFRWQGKRQYAHVTNASRDMLVHPDPEVK